MEAPTAPRTITLAKPNTSATAPPTTAHSADAIAATALNRPIAVPSPNGAKSAARSFDATPSNGQIPWNRP